MSDTVDPPAPQARARARVRLMLDAWEGVAAILVDRDLSVLASTALARAVEERFAEGRSVDAQFARARGAESSPAGREGNEPARFTGTARFVGTASFTGTARFAATAAGPLTLDYTVLGVPEADDDALIVFSPADDATREGLARLSPR